MKRMFLYLPLLLLAMLFAGCSNEEDEDIQDTPVPTALPYRIDVYNADGTKCEIPPTVGDKIKIITNACEEAPDDSWSNRITATVCTVSLFTGLSDLPATGTT